MCAGSRLRAGGTAGAVRLACALQGPCDKPEKTGDAVDLRWRLFGYVLGFALALLAAVAAWVGLALREDVAAEMEAAARLVDVVRAAGTATGKDSEALQKALDGAPLRHVVLSVERSTLEQGVPSLAADGGAGLSSLPVRRIPLGDGTLVIRTDARAEIHEVLEGGLRVMATLLVFSLALAGLAWLAAHRALAPVRELERGLAHLGRGEGAPSLPRFELKEFASIAAAIERLSGELAEARATERDMARRLVELQEAERRELARELHDELGQSLTAIGIAAACIERQAGRAAPEALVASARDIRKESGRTLGLVRNRLAQLRPQGLDGLRVVDALNELVASWRGRAPEIGIEAEFPADLPALPPLAGLALYRTLQEALTNVLRHSVASRVRLSLRQIGSEVELTVADNGVGRSADALPRARGGLAGMRERAAMAGGRCWLDDAPGGGLRVCLSLPVA